MLRAPSSNTQGGRKKEHFSDAYITLTCSCCTVLEEEKYDILASRGLERGITLPVESFVHKYKYVHILYFIIEGMLSIFKRRVQEEKSLI